MALPDRLVGWCAVVALATVACSGEAADPRAPATESSPAVKGLELSEIEDEVYEAETLFSGAKYNSYVKAQAQCDVGSLLFAYVGPGNSGDLPSIGGG